MIWSKFNYLYESPIHGFFLYNSRTNSFIELSEDTFNYLKLIEKSINGIRIENIDEEIREDLLRAKILVNEFDDDNYINQKKYIKYLGNFNSQSLGLVIVPTLACNFTCPYCYEHNLPTDVMSEDIEDGIIKFIKSFKQSKDLQICWHGGEPLLGFNTIVSLLKKIRNEKDINLSVHSLVTNGYLLDEEKCNFFREYNLGSVQITIDGLSETHNNSRKHKSGLPTYEKIISNIEMMFKRNPKCHVIIRMNVYEQNKDECPLLYEELAKKWAGNNFSISMVYASDHGECKVACMKNKRRVNFAKELYEKHNIKNINFYPYSQLGGCTADHANSYIVGPKGELYKCWVDVGKQERIIGYINEDKVNLSLLSEYVVGTDMYTDKKCLSCFLFPVCDGGCPLFRMEHKLNGKEYDVCPIEREGVIIMLDTFYEQQISKQVEVL